MCLSSFYFLTGCLYAVDDVAELFVLLLLPWPFDAVRIATAVKGGEEGNQLNVSRYKKVLFLRVMKTKMKGREH